MGSWADHEGGRYEPGTVIPIRPGSDVAHAQGEGILDRDRAGPFRCAWRDQTVAT